MPNRQSAANEPANTPSVSMTRSVVCSTLKPRVSASHSMSFCICVPLLSCLTMKNRPTNYSRLLFYTAMRLVFEAHHRSGVTVVQLHDTASMWAIISESSALPKYCVRDARWTLYSSAPTPSSWISLTFCLPTVPSWGRI